MNSLNFLDFMKRESSDTFKTDFSFLFKNNSE